MFVAPGEVFDEVKCSPITTANWLTPLVLCIVMSIIFIMTIYSQPQVLQQIRQPVEQQMQKKVSEGKLTQQAADQQMAMIDRFMSPSFMKAMGILSIVIMSPVWLFFVAMVFWLVCTFVFKARYDFMKVVEAVGLCGMIAALGALIMTPLAVMYGNLYVNVGPVLLLKHFDAKNPTHMLIQSINLLTFWYLAVLAIALARFAGTRFFKAALWPFGCWAVLVAFRLAFVRLMAVIGGQ